MYAVLQIPSVSTVCSIGNHFQAMYSSIGFLWPRFQKRKIGPDFLGMFTRGRILHETLPPAKVSYQLINLDQSSPIRRSLDRKHEEVSEITNKTECIKKSVRGKFDVSMSCGYARGILLSHVSSGVSTPLYRAIAWSIFLHKRGITKYPALNYSLTKVQLNWIRLLLQNVLNGYNI